MKRRQWMRRVRQPWRWVPFGIRLRWAGWRSWSGQHRLLRRGTVVVLAMAVVTSIATVRAGAVEERSRWGWADPVVVLRATVVAGHEVDHGDFGLEERPVAMLPPDALKELSVGDVVLRSMHAGEVVTKRDVRSHLSGPTLRRGHHAINIERDVLTPQMHIGSRVDVHVSFERFGEIADSKVVSGRVIDQTDDSITVSVSTDEVGFVAQGISHGSVVVTTAAGD